jgi:uncharacterized protein
MPDFMNKKTADGKKFLNPVIWSSDDLLKTDIRDALLKMADGIREDLKEKLGDNMIPLADIVFTGSLTGPNYDESSDIDLHFIVDYSGYDVEYKELLIEYLRAFARTFNENEYEILGYTVETYFQDRDEKHQSPGIYSVRDNKWVKFPEYQKVLFNRDEAELSNYYKDRILALRDEFETSDTLDYDLFYGRLADMTEELKAMRKKGLDSPDGMYSMENIAFKMLRRNNGLQILGDLKRDVRKKMYGIERETFDESYEDVLGESIFRSLSSSGVESRMMKNPFAIVKAAKDNNTSLVRKILAMHVDVNVNIRDNKDYGDTPLIYAIKYGNVELVKMLLDKGADVNMKNIFNVNALMWADNKENNEIIKLIKDHQTAVNESLFKSVSVDELAARRKIYGDNMDWFTAVEHDNDDRMMALISQGQDVDERHDDTDTFGGTALHKAAERGHCSTVKMLLDAGADINSLDMYEKTPLFWAVLANQPATVVLLLHRGADMNIRDMYGQTAEEIAGRYSTLSKIRDLLKQHSAKMDESIFKPINWNEMDARRKEYGKNMDWFTAVQHHNVERVRELISQGQDVNEVYNGDFSGWETALHRAAAQGFYDMSEALLDAGADINARDMDEQTPLIVAVETNHPVTVRLLLDRGADVSIEDINGNTAESIAKNNPRLVKILNMLRSHAPRRGDVNESIFKHLSGNEMDARRKEYNKRMDWFTAVSWCNVERVRELISQGQDVNEFYEADEMGAMGSTALHTAAGRGFHSIVEMLLDAGADIDTLDMQEQTPLFWAVDGNQPATVKLLLDRGADASIDDMDGDTPENIAEESPRLKPILNMLRDYRVAQS